MDTSGLPRREYCSRSGLSLFLVERRTSLVTPESLLISPSSLSTGTFVGKYPHDGSFFFTSFSGSVRDEAAGRASGRSPASALRKSPHRLSGK